MKILVIAAFNPFPPTTGGAISIYNHIKELSKKHSIYMMCLGTPCKTGDLGQLLQKIEFINPEKVSFGFKLLRCIFLIPARITAHNSPRMQKRVKELIEEHEFDSILLCNISAVQYCPPESYKKAVINLEDPPSIRKWRLSKIQYLPLEHRIIFFVNSLLMRNYENKVLPKLAKVLMLSKADMQDMSENVRHKNLGYVSYGISRRPLNDILPYEKRTEGMIIFSGNMFHLPNIDGALFFLRQIFPLVLKEYPAGVLWIVGSEPDEQIQDAAKHFAGHVVITGKVPDISKYLHQAKVSVCPVRLKIGVQTKVLEALSWGTPVVTTSAGNSGVGGGSGRELWIEDAPNAFAHRIATLLKGENWNTLSSQGKKFADENFSWEHSAMELERSLMAIQERT